MKYIASIISIVGILLFMGNYSICDYFYYNDLEKWWSLKQNLYNVVIFIFQFLAFYYVAEAVAKSVLCFGFMISFANIVDRLFFDVKTFESDDIAMLIFALIFSTLFYFTNKASGTK